MAGGAAAERPNQPRVRGVQALVRLAIGVVGAGGLAALVASCEVTAPVAGQSSAGTTLVLALLTGALGSAIWRRRRASTRLFDPKLQSSLQMHQRAEAIAHVGHWRMKPSGDGLVWSDEIYRLYGYEPGAIEPTLAVFAAAFHSDDRARASAEIAAGLDGKGPIAFQARLIRADGAERQVCVRAERMSTDDGPSLFGVMLDVTAQVRAEAKLLQDVTRLQYALDAGRMFAWDVDLDASWVTYSDNAATVLGWTEAPEGRFLERVHPADRERVRSGTLAAIESGAPYVLDFRLLRVDGTSVWLRDEGRLHTENGRRRFVGLCSDITDLKTAEEALRTSEERLALALDSGRDGLWDWSLTTGESWFSPRWYTMLGYEPGELEGNARTWEALVHPDDKPEVFRRTAAHLEGQTPDYKAEFRMRTKSGEFAWVLSRGKVAQRDADGRPLRIIGTHIDIGERKAAEVRIAFMARHDPLTNLPNRALFHERLDQMLEALQPTGDRLAVLCLDLDRFKTVNDTLGHAAGDTLLREVALRLRSCTRVEDVVARLGGDEFAILSLCDGDTANNAALLASRLIDAIRPPLSLEGKPASVGISIGIALAPADGVEGDKLFKCADRALYRAKNEGRNTFRFFEPRMDDEVEERRNLEALLVNALANGEFALHYQPIVEAQTSTIIGFEALLRWSNPKRGSIPPTVFIPLAEESGLIVPLGRWVLQTACAAAVAWPDALMVAVNISPVQFRRPELVEDVVAALAMAGLPPGRLELEATESMLLDSNEDLLHTMQNLRSLGIRIALDDFGTGYSSLSYLCRFPFDRIKIDRSFVAALEDDKSAAIVHAVVGLGRQFGMAVTAEGVETEDQSMALRGAGCSLLQGYYFSQPRPAAEIPALLASRNDRAAA